MDLTQNRKGSINKEPRHNVNCPGHVESVDAVLNRFRQSNKVYNNCQFSMCVSLLGWFQKLKPANKSGAAVPIATRTCELGIPQKGNVSVTPPARLTIENKRIIGSRLKKATRYFIGGEVRRLRRKGNEYTGIMPLVGHRLL